MSLVLTTDPDKNPKSDIVQLIQADHLEIWKFTLKFCVDF